MTVALALLAAAFALSAWLARRLTVPGGRLHVVDHPNERSLHDRPVPRTGGLAILGALAFCGTAAVLLNGAPRPLVWIAAGVALLALVSFLDDCGGVKRRYRIITHLVAASLLPLAGLVLDRLELGAHTLYLPIALAVPLTLVFGVWMINLYNFMDGMDGFAGGMALFGFGTLAMLAWQGGGPALALCAALVAAAAGGFLLFNFPPARIFLGDVGSAPLGFLAAALSLWGSAEGWFPLWAALLAFSPFIVDATLTLVRRAARGERVWEAHRSHYYQRLVLLGWGHRTTVLRAYLLMMACSVSAVQGARMAGDEPVWLLGMWAAIYALIALKVRWIERPPGFAP